MRLRAGGGSFVSFPVLLFTGVPAARSQCHQHCCAMAGLGGERHRCLSEAVGRAAAPLLLPYC